MDATGKRKTVLIVEDEPSTRAIYKAVFEKEGYDVIEAHDGHVGWTMAKEHKPDLILLDLTLPHVEGFDVLNKIRENYHTSKTPVIVFTATKDHVAWGTGMLLGADDYLVKGQCTPEDVVERVRARLHKPSYEETPAGDPPLAKPAPAAGPPRYVIEPEPGMAPAQEMPATRTEKPTALPSPVETNRVSLHPGMEHEVLTQNIRSVVELCCPSCETPMTMKLTPNFARTSTEPWFTVRFVCSRCQKSF